jgi:cyclophilin family peptidyl-prolyl cis-trans isomerase
MKNTNITIVHYFAFCLLIGFILISCNAGKHAIKGYNPDLINQKAPEKFRVVFVTTKGNIEVTAERKYSPLAVDRFYQLIKSNYFIDMPFYRGVPNFVIQFGTLDTLLENAWSQHILVDEPVLKSNEAGTIAFARADVNTRGSQLFINLKNNTRLDTVSYGGVTGFPTFGYVSSGMELVNKIYTGYNDEPRIQMGSIGEKQTIKEYLITKFPELDYIKRAYLVVE